MSTRSATDIDPTHSVSVGLIAGLTVIFMGLVGLAVGLNERILIDPILSLGYLFLLAVPLVAGYIAANETVLEGMQAPEKGGRDVLAGGLAGLAGGATVGLFLILLDTVDLSEKMPAWGERLSDMLSFNQGVVGGIAVTVIVGTVLGALGGAIHVLGDEPRRVVKIVTMSVLSFAILEAIVDDVLGEIGLKSVAKFLYSKSGGLSLLPAVLVGVAATGLAIGFKGKGTELKTRYDTMEEVERKNVNKYALIAAAVAAVVLPFLLGKIVNELLANVGLFVLLALGLNIVVGRAGILDIGYVAFFAVGAYGMAVLTTPEAPWRINDTLVHDIFGWLPVLPWLVALPIVVVATGFVGLLIGTPVIRMRGDYLAIVTLGFGEIIRLLFLSDWLSPTLGGSQGIRNIPGVNLGVTEINGTKPQYVFYLVAVFVALAIYISHQMETSRIGRAWMAIREDEPVAEAMGINTVTTKLIAFVTGAVLASFSGAIFAAKVGSTFPNSFLLLVSIIILVVVIVGGMGNIPGVIVGAVVLIGILGGPKQPGLLAEFSQFKLLIYGALLVFMMLKKPEGLLPNAARTRELHIDEALQDAWLKGDKPGSEDEVATA